MSKATQDITKQITVKLEDLLEIAKEPGVTEKKYTIFQDGEVIFLKLSVRKGDIVYVSRYTICIEGVRLKEEWLIDEDGHPYKIGILPDGGRIRVYPDWSELKSYEPGTVKLKRLIVEEILKNISDNEKLREVIFNFIIESKYGKGLYERRREIKEKVRRAFKIAKDKGEIKLLYEISDNEMRLFRDYDKIENKIINGEDILAWINNISNSNKYIFKIRKSREDISKKLMKYLYKNAARIMKKLEKLGFKLEY